ncbi:MAG TPA: aldose 1-epimerase family protein [Bacteroidia bacterium]|jgi:galactose mutarotase-like enzyme
MNLKIENELLSVEVSTLGAELSSVLSKKEQTEFLWQGDPGWWPRKAPVLFPIVGKLNNNSYVVNGKKYDLTQHGFARDKEFKVLSQGEDHLVFSLSSDAETLKVYPFEFELQVRYDLIGNKLTTTYEIRNTGKTEMLFSIGAHPGFNCSLDAASSFSDHYLEFEKAEVLNRHLLSQGCFNGQTENVMEHTHILDLNEDLFRKDAIVFKNMESSFMYLKSRKKGSLLKFEFRGFPYFGIWTKPGAPFICLEPWCGIADNTTHKGELKIKEGINSLGAGENFTRSFSVEIF